MPRFHSFDVFDTVLTRTVADPRAVHRLWATRAPDVAEQVLDPVALALSRHRVERELNDRTERHAPLHVIHRELARRHGWTTVTGDRLAELEQQVELDLVKAVPGMATILEDRRATGPLIFVSDTPHSEEFVRLLLSREGLCTEDDLVFTSSARGATKSRGGLFQLISRELGTRDILHHGDDVHADVASARFEGWRAQWWRTGLPTRYEAELISRDVETGGLGATLAGVGRIARLRATDHGLDPAIAAVTTGAMTPLLVGYVCWTLHRARQLGLERLYFVSRDGEVMLRVARAFSWIAPDVELRYLWGSRQPWVLGASASHPDLFRSWVLGRTDFTATTALERLGIEAPEFFASTRFAAAAPVRADTVLTRDEREELARLILLPPWADRVRSTAQAVADRCIEYFRQEGLLEGRRFGLVDAGWSGRASAALDELVRRGSGTAGIHFYVGHLGNADLAPLREGVKIEPWLFDQLAHPGSLGELTGPNVLVEMFCAGSTGRTIDYAVDEDGRWAPVLDRPRNDEAMAWGLEAVHELAVEAAAEVGQLWQRQIPVDLTPAVRRVLEHFWERPSDAEVRAWGSFPGEEEIWPPFMALAQSVSTSSVVARLRRGETQLRPNNTWRAGSAMVSRPPWSTLVRLKAWRQLNPRAGRVWRRRQALRALRLWARRTHR